MPVLPAGTAPLVRALVLGSAALLAACAPAPPPAPEQFVGGIPASQIVPGYGLISDRGFTLPPIPPEYLQGVNRRAFVPYRGELPPGTIEIDPHAKFLYWIQPGGMAWRYPIAVGRDGREMSGATVVRRKAAWPSWMPTANMLRREPEVYGPFRDGVRGGLANPLGARALYLYRGGRDTFFRIHGTNDLASIGNEGSAGCIRMFNHDIIHLYDMVPEGTAVVVRSYTDSVRIEGELMANRGIELPPVYASAAEFDIGTARQRPPVPQAMIPERYFGDPAAQAAALRVSGASDPVAVAALGAAAPIPLAQPSGTRIADGLSPLDRIGF
jgi:lipoprotein-anchoring transpeptidase ErfK/SrfK